MAMKGGKSYTVADIEALPEGQRAELIDGEMFMMASPTLTHQELLVRISANIWNYISGHKGECRVLPAPFAVYIKNDDRHYVEPDISVICDEKKLDEKGCHGAPDWVIEIVSPTSGQMDYVRKFALYQTAGVREYWIVDPQQETVTVYDLEHGGEAVEYSFSERIKVGIYEDLTIELIR
ncbi:MAG: Uma2 family endonuclease [Lachnospiraceae bacterium]|nr:Uma2 family endonuclease [Lachnospiraceae bacterium]